MTTKGRELLKVIEHWGGFGEGTIEIMIQSGYTADSDDPSEIGRVAGAFRSVLRGLERRGLVTVQPDGIEITDTGRRCLGL